MNMDTFLLTKLYVRGPSQNFSWVTNLFTFCKCCNMSIAIAATHTEAVLNKMSKSELVQLALQTEASLASHIKKLWQLK